MVFCQVFFRLMMKIMSGKWLMVSAAQGVDVAYDSNRVVTAGCRSGGTEAPVPSAVMPDKDSEAKTGGDRHPRLQQAWQVILQKQHLFYKRYSYLTSIL